MLYKHLCRPHAAGREMAHSAWQPLAHFVSPMVAACSHHVLSMTFYLELLRRLRESMILPDDIPRSLIGQQSGDAADASPDNSSACRRRSESDTHADRRGAARSERPDRAAGRLAGEQEPSRQLIGRSLANTVRDVLEGGSTEVRLSSARG